MTLPAQLSPRVAALLASAVASCNNESRETTSVASPIVAAITDDSFRAASTCPDCTVTARSTVTLPLTGGFGRVDYANFDSYLDLPDSSGWQFISSR